MFDAIQGCPFRFLDLTKLVDEGASGDIGGGESYSLSNTPFVMYNSHGIHLISQLPVSLWDM